MYFYVYIIKNRVNKKVYVGKTNNLVIRWASHRSASKDRSNRSRFYRAIRKIGIEHFYIEILERTKDEKKAYQLERKWIRLLQSHTVKYGYNTLKGYKPKKSPAIKVK